MPGFARPRSVLFEIALSDAVFYTSSDCYQYSIIDEGGVVLEPDDIFWTPDAAEREGREAINTVSRNAIAISVKRSPLVIFSVNQ